MDDSMTLPDGRALAYVILGDPGGDPLFVFHGTPGSRLELSDDDLLARLPGIRLILPDRPGYGRSDPHPERTLLDWAGDVAQLADHLGHERFAVAGASGGGPHALACAYALPGRVTVALVFSSPAPAGVPGATRGLALGNRLGIWLGRIAPGLVRRGIASAAAAFRKDPERYLDAMTRQMAPPDRAFMRDPAFRAACVRDFDEAFRQGPDAQWIDGALGLTSRDWGFQLRDIAVPVHLWHGEEDVLVTVAMARHLEREIPRCTARIVPGAGHLLVELPSVVDEVAEVLRSAGDDG